MIGLLQGWSARGSRPARWARKLFCAFRLAVLLESSLVATRGRPRSRFLPPLSQRSLLKCSAMKVSIFPLFFFFVFFCFFVFFFFFLCFFFFCFFLSNAGGIILPPSSRPGSHRAAARPLADE